MTDTLTRRHTRKISPDQQASAETLAHYEETAGTALGPGEPALSEWRRLGLELPDLDAMRRYRLGRVRDQLVARDCAAIVVADPLNIRYAVDSPNMQLWCTHNAVRYCFVPVEGPIVLFDFHNCEHLSDGFELIDEVRQATSWFYFGAGPHVEARARKWAAEIGDLLAAHGGGNKRLAIDRCNPEGLAELERLGIDIVNGEEIMEIARVIKGEDDIKAMRCAIATSEIAMRIMHDALEPGITEQRLWSILHAENIARGGEWIETRLLASGPRTNPWFHECGARVIENGDLVAFDTDLIGPYGSCSDISRTWLAGDKRPTNEQRHIYAMAHEQIVHDTKLLRPGVGFVELAEKAYRLDDDFLPNRYSCLYHGVGLCDEYPHIGYLEDSGPLSYDGVVEAGMVLCVESYIGRVGGREGVKLEEQVLIGNDGPIVLSSYPFEESLL